MDQDQNQNRPQNNDRMHNKGESPNKEQLNGKAPAQAKNREQHKAQTQRKDRPPRREHGPENEQTPHKNRPQNKNGGQPRPKRPRQDADRTQNKPMTPAQGQEQKQDTPPSPDKNQTSDKKRTSGAGQAPHKNQPPKDGQNRGKTQGTDKNHGPRKNQTPASGQNQSKHNAQDKPRTPDNGQAPGESRTQAKGGGQHTKTGSEDRITASAVPNLEHKKDRSHTAAAGTKDGVPAKDIPRIPVNIHVVLLGIIVLIAAFSAYRLYKWNKGVPSDYDPNYQTDAFDVEAMDNIIPLAPDKLEGREDDGVTTILCLGDDPFSLNQGEGGLAEQIAAMTGAAVHNGSFTGTTIAAQFESYNDGYILDAFSFSYVAQSLASGNFDLMKTAATYSYDEAFPKTTAMLEALDMNSIDVICIMYDASDYINKRPCDDPNAPNAIITYTGALRTGIEAIQEAYPHIRIAVMSHTFCHHVNEEGNFENGDRTDLGHGTLSHYLQKELDATSDCGVSFIDNFYGSINEDNYLNYMTDYIHFNDAGRRLLAERFVQTIFPDLWKTQAGGSE